MHFCSILPVLLVPLRLLGPCTATVTGVGGAPVVVVIADSMIGMMSVLLFWLPGSQGTTSMVGEVRAKDGGPRCTNPQPLLPGSL